MALLHRLLTLPLIAVLLLTSFPQAPQAQAQAQPEPSGEPAPAAIQPAIYLPLIQHGTANISATITPAGGELSTADQRVRLIVPAGAVAEPVTVFFSWNGGAPQLSGLVGLSSAFNLTARTLQGRAVTQFAKPLQVHVQLSENTSQTVALFYYDTSEQRWVGLPSSFNTQSRVLTGTTDHFTTFVAANAVPCGVGEGAGVPLEVTTAFQQAYNRNGGFNVMGVAENCVHGWWPERGQTDWVQDFPDMPNWGKSLILWNPNQRKAYVVRGWIRQRYMDTFGGMGDDGKNGPGSWLGLPISDETVAPPDIVSLDTSPSGQHPWSYGGEPINYFERGYISRRQGESAFASNTYLPALCSVNIRVEDDGNGRPSLRVLAYVNRAPGWPTADQSSDPIDGYFTAVFPSGKKSWVSLTQTDNHTLSATIGPDAFAEPLVMGQTIRFYMDVYNRRGQAQGWKPGLRTFPKAVAYQQGWPQYDSWVGSRDALMQITLQPGADALPNDNWQCPGSGAGGPGGGIVKVPPVAEAGGEEAGGPFGSREVNVGEAVILDGSQSRDPDGGTITGYSWRLIAAPPRRGSEIGRTFSGRNPVWMTVLWQDMGGWAFDLTVTDDEGQTDTDRVYITVRDGDPDHDGLGSDYERYLQQTKYPSSSYPSPQDADSDDDGLSDAWEESRNLATRPNLFSPYYYRLSEVRQQTALLMTRSELRHYGSVSSFYEFRARGASAAPTFSAIEGYPSHGGLKFAFENVSTGPDYRGIIFTNGSVIETKWHPWANIRTGFQSLDFNYSGANWYGTVGGSSSDSTLRLIAIPEKLSENLPENSKVDVQIKVLVEPVGGIRALRRGNQGIVLGDGPVTYRQTFTKREEGGLKSVGLNWGDPFGGSWGLKYNVNGEVEVNLSYLSFSFAGGSTTEGGVNADYRGGEFSLTQTVLERGNGQITLTNPEAILDVDLRSNSHTNDADIIRLRPSGAVIYSLDGKEVQRDTFQGELYVLILRNGYGGQQVALLSAASVEQIKAATRAPDLAMLQAPTTTQPRSTLPETGLLISTAQISLTDSYAGQPVDTNGDAKYDAFTVDVGVSADQDTSAYVRGQLFAGETFIAWDQQTISLPAGTSIASLRFDGLAIHQAQINGPLSLRNLQVEPLDGGLVINAAAPYTTTNTYSSSSFRAPEAVFAGSADEQPLDDDGDGHFDRLQIRHQLDIRNTGVYTVSASLFNQTGQLVASAQTQVAALGAGPAQMQLDFPGLAISEAGLNGPYAVRSLEVSSAQGQILDRISDPYTTTAYLATQFQTPPVRPLTDQFGDSGIDTNANGHYNFLQIDAALNLKRAGNYLVRGALADRRGTVIWVTDYRGALPAGDSRVPLLFDGRAIGEHGVNGPYSLDSLEVIDVTTNETVGWWTAVYTTAFYRAPDFEGGVEPPNLADVEDGNLVLNMGTRASRRGIAVDEVNERFVVRQLNQEGTLFSIEAFGAYEEEQISAGGRVIADGSSGDDVVVLAPGVDSDGSDASFTAAAQLDGGAGNDELRAGAGNDRLTGGDGNDILHGGAGDDELGGGTGADNLTGGLGKDTASGDEGDDTLLGDEGDSELPGDIATSADTLIGGPGADQLFGNAGDDQLFGDEQLTCTDVGQSPGGNDMLRGGLGNDQLLGGGGNDTLRGEASDDTLCGNGDDDLLDGDSETVTDVIGNDTLRGGNGADELHGRGGDDDLFGEADNDRLFGEAGSDDLSGGLGTDYLDGGEGRDYLFGDDGRITRAPSSADAEDVVFSEDVGAADAAQGGPGDDVIYGEGGADELRGGDSQDLLYGNAGNDIIDGEAGNDTLRGNAGDDTVRGGPDNDDMEGNAGRDALYGSDGNDDGRGGDGDDLLRGEGGDDRMAGNAGADDIAGGLGDDDLIGGSSAAGQPDAGDQITGNEGHDVIAGDNTQITRPGDTNVYEGSPVRAVTLLDIDVPDATLSGPDVIDGGAGNDRAFGQGASDTIRGRADDDYLEGNAAADTLYGGAGQDDIVGGSDTHGRQDGADNLWGDDGPGDTAADQDVIAGDNARIVRPLDSTGRWQVNAFNGSVRRTVTLYDVGELGQPALPAGVSGAETIYGQGGDDLIYGQGGDDTIWGGAGDDYAEGNAGADAVNGEGGNDDLVGGTGRINSDGPQGADGRLDGSDTLRGGPGFDVIAGDNAVLARTLVDGRWQQNSFNGGIHHDPRILRDVDAAQSSMVIGADIIYGDADDDLLYGQGGADAMYGGAGDDYAEGNAAGDRIYGDAGQDDLIGGSPEFGLSDGNDIVEGGADADVALGDNGTIMRPLDAQGRWQRLTGYGYDIVVRALTMANTAEAATAFGNDQVKGGDGPDELYGQLGDDTVLGEAGEDVLIGDLGLVVTRIEDGSRQRLIRSNQPFLEETIYTAGTLTRQVELLAFAENIGGADTLLGGDGNDSAHGGPGNDLVNGNAGTDSLFGSDGDDAIWGGPDRDYLWGGHGNDWLDVKPRPASGGRMGDPQAWFAVAGLDNYQGYDLAYGGWGQDAMQGDVGGPGLQPGDRLIDWVGAYNVYYVCPAAYGEGMITRSHSPSVVAFLQQLAESGGASNAAVSGSSGFRELGLVQNNEARFNANPPHPDHPGHFTCN